MLKHHLQVPAIIALFLLIFIGQGCGPSQEELTIGALKHFHRGNQLFAKNDPRQAIHEYKMAITLDKQQSVFHYNLGLAYYRLVLYEQAIEAYRDAITHQPELGEAWYNLSLALDKIGETDKAFLAYERYQKLNQAQIQAQPKADQPKPVIVQKPKTPVTQKKQ